MTNLLQFMKTFQTSRKQTIDFFTLLDQFIFNYETGKHLLKNGTRMQAGTIRNYRSMRKLLLNFTHANNLNLQVKNLANCTSRQFLIERNYWKRIYRKLSNFMYKKRNLHDNYVGTTYKLIRSFINYLNFEKGIDTKQLQNIFYPVSEEIPVVALSSEQFNKLIYDKGFEELLPYHLKVSKDIFVFGCTVGLRVSDLFALNQSNLERVYDDYYIKVISQKTKITTRVKIPDFAVSILSRYKKNKKNLLPRFQLFTLNKYFKKIGELAGWTYSVEKKRSKRGLQKEILTLKENKTYRFCDLLSSHTMRRTAITTMLNLGMQEHLARKISGHVSGSKEFFKYVQYSQNYIDSEIEKVYTKLKSLNNIGNK